MAKKKNRKTVTPEKNNSFVTDNQTIPAISVIIPMYNAEKYVGECLDSILAQTFTDYEVIVVDDCSTDKSAAIVENFIPKFKGKLNLVHLKVNSGGYPGIIRNTGLKIARGNYIMFVDSDDIITKTAFEELYPVAQEFNADVVSCEKFFQTPINGNIYDKNSLEIMSPPIFKFVEKPTLVTNDMEKRLIDLYNFQFTWSSWMKLIRRNFIFENNIEMPDISGGEDTIFNCCLICANAKYVRVPNIIYIYRRHEGSIYHSYETIQKSIHKWGEALTKGFNHFNNFLNRQDFFRKNPYEKFVALEVAVREFSQYFVKCYSTNPQYNITQSENIRAEFENCKNLPELTAFLFNRMNLFDLNLKNQQAQIEQLQAQLKKAAEYLSKQQELIKQMQ